ncbi:1-acyl-sn-glycerol-3-phosphate acyltransferase [Croceicoccus naphthovorans]|nr:lysophospholipid acyltransferase family protein [Croceicoccus naphthovorans]MBB3988707.1 1-acyl-sn-glycerol-3-phosphate acyltransferase [Croceicoccus naphthovorans]
MAALIVWLILCVGAFYIAAPFTRRNPVPPRFLAGVATIAGVRVRRIGSISAPRAVLLANHLSWLDIPLLAGTTGSVFVAHDGLAGNRALKWLCDMNDTVFIARSRRSTVAHQVDQVREALDAARVLTVFPEGTTNDGTALLPIKSALLSALDTTDAGTAIHPVALSYGDATQEIAWVGNEPGATNFFNVLGRGKPIDATVTILPALTGEALNGRKAIAEATRDALTKAMAGW